MNAGWARSIVIWALAFAGCLVAFGAIGWLVSQPGIPPIDTAVTNFLHGFANPTLDAVMAAVTNLGSTAVLAVVVGLAAVILAVMRRPAEAVFLVVALVGSLLLNDMLKAVYQRPRPGFDWAALPPETGFPSGHSMNSFVVYVAIALVIWRLRGRAAGIPAFVVATALFVNVGISRIYLGAHWLTDVVGAYLAGASWLLFLVAVFAGVSWLRGSRRPDGRRTEGKVGDVPSRPAR